MKKLIIIFILSLIIMGDLLLGVFRTTSAQSVDEGDIISKNVDNPTQDLQSLQKPLPLVTELWVDDDYTNVSCGGHMWGVDAFNQIQAAIDAVPYNSTTTINVLSGDYYERVTIDKPVYLVGEDIGVNQYAVNISGESGDVWALICVSANDMGGSDQFPDRDCFPAQGLQAYYALKNIGYDDEHIILMLWHDDETAVGYDCEPNDDNDTLDENISIYDGTHNWLFGPDGAPGVAGVDDDNNGTADDLATVPGEYPPEFGWPGSDDPEIDVKNTNVTKDTLLLEITNLSNLVTVDDHVLFFFVNHGRKYGTPERCHIYFEDPTNGTAGQYLDAATLDSWLDQIKCRRMTIMLDMCRTQNFINSSANFTAESNRLIIGASGDIDNIAHAWYNAVPTHFAGSWFFHPFWLRINAGSSVGNAYKYALSVSDQLAEDYPYPYQLPIIIDRIRDAEKYYLLPYESCGINYLDPTGNSSEIDNIQIKGNGLNSSIGINQENYYIDITQALINDTDVGFEYITANCVAEDSIYFKFFPSSQSELNDSFMIGSDKIFSRIYIKLSSGGGGLGGAFILEYAIDKNRWDEIDIQMDSTNGLTQSGDILFTPPIAWAYQAHNQIKTNEKSKYAFWVRLRLKTKYTTIPEGNYIDLSYYSQGNLTIQNNRITLNDYGIYFKGITTQMTNRGIISGCTINNNQIAMNNKRGIYLLQTSNNLISYNKCVSNTWSGIRLNDSFLDSVENNICYNNEYGISLISSTQCFITDNNCHSNIRSGIYIGESENITISDNTCNANNWSSIRVWLSNYNTIQNNTCNSNNWSGIAILGNYNTLINNTCNLSENGNGIYLELDAILNTLKNNRCNLNKVGGIYIESKLNTIIDNTCNSNKRSGIYLDGYSIAEKKSNTLIKNICNSNNWSGIYLARKSNSNLIKNNTCYSNTFMGIIIDGASDNMIDNCTLSSNLNFDFYFENNSKNNVAINTTFNSIYFYDSTSELIIKNYLHLQVNDSGNSPIQDVDINIKDNDKNVYSTPGYGGSDPTTDSIGRCKWILLTDRIYGGNSDPTENVTIARVEYNGIMFWNNSRHIDMSTSHFEHFYPNSIPTKIILESPANNSYLNNSLPEFNWTAGFDVNGDALTYELQVAETGDDWTTLVAYGNTEANELNWTVTMPLLDGNYYWRVCANDSLQNGSWSEVWRFTIDTTAPSSVVSMPITNEYYNKLNELSGTATDPMNGTGVVQVEITIKRLSDKHYWDGIAWSTTPKWLLAEGTTTWSYDSSTVTWVSGTQYIVQSRAWDLVNNIEEPTSEYIFNFDLDKPSSSIRYPLNNTFLNYVDNITGNAEDSGGAGIKLIEICILRVNDNYYWNGTAWVSQEFWLTADGKEEWSFGTEGINWSTDFYYRIISRATDNVSNLETQGHLITFMYDNKPPECSISINNEAVYTSSNSVILSLHAMDSGSGVTQMAFGSNIYQWSAWQTFNTSKSFTLPSNDGPKSVFFKVRDKANNTAITSDTIILDTTPPRSLSIIINNGSLETNSTIVKLELSALDALSGVYQMSFSTDGKTWTTWEPFASERSFSLTPNDGGKVIYFRVNDLVGNTASPVSMAIILNTTSPPINDTTPDDEKPSEEDEQLDMMYWTILILVAIIIILMIIIFFIFFILKRKKSETPEPEEILESEE